MGRACAGGAHAKADDTGHSSANPKGGVSYCCFMMGTNSKTKNA